MKKISNFKFQISNSRGITLIELIVVMVVFLLILAAVVGVFLSIVQRQRAVLYQQQLSSQISYIEEHVSKALRSAGADTLGTCLGSTNKGYIYLLANGGKDIKFINQSDSNACQEIFLDASGVLKEIKNGNTAVALNSSALQINSAKFIINGSTGSTFASNEDSVQPRVTMLLNIGISGEPARIIQTTVSQRNLNVYYEISPY